MTLAYLHDRFFAGHVKNQADPEEAWAGAEVADLVHDARRATGLTQRELARRIGTGASVICRLERDEYRGHGLAMLRRIAWALGKRVEIGLVDREREGTKEPPPDPTRTNEAPRSPF